MVYCLFNLFSYFFDFVHHRSCSYFTLGKIGFYFIPFAGLLFSSWVAIYLIFALKCNYVSSNGPAIIVLSALIPIGGFIAGIPIAVHILKWYKEFLRDNTNEKLWKAAFYWKL